MNRRFGLEFVTLLYLVSNELKEYSDEVVRYLRAGKDPTTIPWRWSTYALEAQAAVFAQLKADRKDLL